MNPPVVPEPAQSRPPSLRYLERFLKTIFPLYLIALATSMSGMEIFSTGLVVGLLAYLAIRRPPRELWVLPPLWAPILTFIVVAVIGIVISDAVPKDKWYDICRMRFFFVYFALFYQLRFFADDLKWTRWSLAVCVVVGIYGFFQHFIPLDLVRPAGKKIYMYAIQKNGDGQGPLVLGCFNHHLTFSNVFLFYACLFVALGSSAFENRRKHWLKWGFLGVGALLYLLCFWTESRVAWFAIPVTLVCLALGLPRGKQLAAAAVAVCLASMGIFYCTDVGFRLRFNRTFLMQDDLYNLGPRMRLWRAQFAMLYDSPWFGLGLNNNERKSKEYVDRLYPSLTDNFYGHAHNAFLQVLAGTGVFGLVAYLWIWVDVFRIGLRKLRRYAVPSERRGIALGCLAAFVGFQIQGLTQWNFGDAEVTHNVMFFWAVIATL